ncbi:putative potassium channel, voltage-dependent, ERG [Rosa chinensis]|uniref:Putative potassium channel, voltage-dependent, ERG n=2 Tax=Rosa chinensis TaxID=74649 RepID=A0A2P6S1I0_ROSCH|nr:putative potassium channel, voltage-dependent, ERG [Rosa chinensis]
MRKAWSKVTLIWDIYSAGTTIMVKIIFSRVIRSIHEILSWKWIFVVSCIAVSLDPLFLYIPIIEGNKCLGTDRNLRIVTLVLRSLIDITFITHIIGLISDWKYSDGPQRHVSYFDSHFEPASGLLWKLKFLKQAIAKRMPWLSGTVMIHFLAILPIPQVAIVYVFARIGSSEFFLKTAIINLFLVFQYFPRVCQIYLSSKKLNMTGTWVKGGFNLFLYILASHVIAAYWYFFAIQREISCWHQACEKSAGCLATYVCGGSTSMNITFQNELCPIFSPNTTLFDFGIFLDILQSGNAGSVNFLTKFCYSLWWGLKNLSSFGTNLETSSYWWENCFAILICVVGLVLFLHLVGNVQTYMQFQTTKSASIADSRRTRIKAKYRDINKWMSKHGLPADMKTAIRKDIKEWNIAGRYIDHDVDVRFVNNICGGNIVLVLSEFFRLNALKKVPMLQNVPEFGLILISQYLYLETYDENAVVARAGKPIDSMFFIIDGVIDWTDETNMDTDAETTGSSSSSNSSKLKNGDYFGQELLSWAAFNYGSSYFSPVPTSTRDAKCRTKVEVLQLSRGTLVNTEVCDYMPQSDSLAHLEELAVPHNHIDQIIDEYPVPKVKWKCPYRGWLKVNCSAVWERESRVAGMAWVCRKDEGAFVAAGSLGGIRCMDRFFAEALSIAKAIEFCTTIISDVSGDNVGRIIVESDNQDLMDCLLQLHDEDLVVPKTYLNNSSLEPNNRIGENLRPILGDIFIRLAPGFKAITYVHCDSQCNAAAHCVASHAMDDATDSSSWYGPDPAPRWLIPALTKDSPHLYT